MSLPKITLFNQAREVASEIKARMTPECTPGDLFAIGSQFTDSSEVIDKAIDIVFEGLADYYVNSPPSTGSS